MSRQITHLGPEGEAVMVDITEKTPTIRKASASGKIYMRPDTLNMVLNRSAIKGDVLAVARVAGIMAAKKTDELIPLCHQVPVTQCKISFAPNLEGGFISAACSVTTHAATGVEMEALTGVTASLLTIYDMLKAADRAMRIADIIVDEKSGGQSGVFLHPDSNKNKDKA